jgi:hypothetical protein
MKYILKIMFKNVKFILDRDCKMMGENFSKSYIYLKEEQLIQIPDWNIFFVKMGSVVRGMP